MTPAQRELARHALGLTNGRRKSYRNHFVADPGSDDHEHWNALEKAGLARVQRRVDWIGGCDCFWLTREGAVLALNDGESLDDEDFPERRPQ